MDAPAAGSPASPTAQRRVSTQRAALGPALATLAGVLLILSPTLLFPFGRDQAVFAYVGKVMASGGMPYRDAWDLKPPGIYLLYALLAALTPNASGMASMVALRVMDLLVAGVTGLLLARLTQRWTGEAWLGPVAAAWYAALYLKGTFWSLGQAEAWANPLLLGAALLLAGGLTPASNWRLLVAGSLLGGALLLKPTAILPLLPFAWMACGGLRPRWKGWALLALGSALPLLLAVLWLAAGHALGSYLDVQRGFVASYSQLNAPTLWKRVENVCGYTGGWLLEILFPALLAAAGLLFRSGWHGQEGREQEQGPRVLVGVAMLLGLVAVWAQNKYFGYHWQSALPWLSILAAVGLGMAMRAAGARGPMLALMGVPLALGWSYLMRPFEYSGAMGRAMGTVSERRWLARFGPPGGGDYSFLADLRVSRYLQAHTVAGDKILIWGMEPAVYLLSGRPSPTRFFFNVPVASPLAPASWREEYLQAVRRDRPTLFLVLRHDPIPWASGTTDDSATLLRQWPELERWMAANYERETEIEDFTLYRVRKAGAPPKAVPEKKPR